MEQLRSLLNRTRVGDLEAFGRVVDRFQNMAFGYACSMLGSRHDAEDAVQEAFVAAFAKLGDLRDVDRFPGWFRRIVLSTCREVIRKRPPVAVPLAKANGTASPDGGPPQELERKELREAVMSAVQSLSAVNRAATMLFYIALQRHFWFRTVPAPVVVPESGPTRESRPWAGRAGKQEL